jgi:mannose-6-phosphate isomerase-like protein (cupin superfamily)
MTDAGPHELDTMRLVLAPGGHGDLRPVTARFYEELETDHPDGSGAVLIQRHAFDAPWPTWEMHPRGDEFVYLLAGDTDLLLRDGAVERVLRLQRPGQFVLVPRGSWHTARPRMPTELLFVTPGDGTENRETPPS